MSHVTHTNEKVPENVFQVILHVFEIKHLRRPISPNRTFQIPDFKSDVKDFRFQISFGKCRENPGLNTRGENCKAGH